MNIAEVQAVIIPALSVHCNAPIIQGDQIGDRPTGPHATYKFTMAYGKGVGKPDLINNDDGLALNEIYKENFRATISFTAYAMDDDESRELAQKIHDWLAFHGQQTLSENEIVVIDLTDIINRDAFVIEDYERRNGFDCILRLSREVTNDNIDYFDHVEWIKA